MRLLEVVADELVELGEIRRRLVEPVGVALVQLRAQALRRRAIDRLLHEDVAEAEQRRRRAGRTKPRSASVAGARRRVGAASGSSSAHDVVGA